MENQQNEKKAKVYRPPSTTGLRVRKDTKKRVLADLARINKKDLGGRIRVDDYLLLGLGLITAEHIQQLQEGSLTNADRLERDYRTYVSQNGPISKDEYLGKRLKGEIT